MKTGNLAALVRGLDVRQLPDATSVNTAEAIHILGLMVDRMDSVGTFTFPTPVVMRISDCSNGKAKRLRRYWLHNNFIERVYSGDEFNPHHRYRMNVQEFLDRQLPEDLQ